MHQHGSAQDMRLKRHTDKKNAVVVTLGDRRGRQHEWLFQRSRCPYIPPTPVAVSDTIRSQAALRPRRQPWRPRPVSLSPRSAPLLVRAHSSPPLAPGRPFPCRQRHCVTAPAPRRRPRGRRRPQQHEAAARSSPRGPASGRSGGRASCPSKDTSLTGWYGYNSHSTANEQRLLHSFAHLDYK